MAPTGDVTEVQLGPGTLYVAQIGTAEPVSASAALASAFREVGWTDKGSEFQYELKAEDIFVAEEFDPVKVATVSRQSSISFEMKQASRQNLALALNAGASEPNTAATFEPPAPGTEVRVLIVWDGDNGARWVFRRCFQAAPISIKRDKAPAVAMLPVTFRLEKSTTPGQQPFRVFPTAAGLID